MTDEQKDQYRRKYQTQTAKYERSGVVLFRRAIADMVKPVAAHVANHGVQDTLAMLDILFKREILEAAYIKFYMYVGRAHYEWSDKEFNARLQRKKDRNMPPPPNGLVAVTPADAGFGAGFFNIKWVRSLQSLVYKTSAAQMITGVTNRLKKKIRNILGRSVRLEVRPSVIAAQLQDEMGGQLSEKRARLIARTETTKISNLASRQQAIDSGLELDKFWIHTNDDRVRDNHEEVPDLIDMNDKFNIGGKLMDHPGDPEGGAENCCNCRCCAAYVPKSTNDDILRISGQTSSRRKINI